MKEGHSSPDFLNLGPSILDQMVLCYGTMPLIMGRSGASLDTHARVSLPSGNSPTPRCGHQDCLQTSPRDPGGAESLRLGRPCWVRKTIAQMPDLTTWGRPSPSLLHDTELAVAGCREAQAWLLHTGRLWGGTLCITHRFLPGLYPTPAQWGERSIHTPPKPSRTEGPRDSRKAPTTIICFQTTLLFCLVGKLINYLESNISLFASEKGSASLTEPGFET